MVEAAVERYGRLDILHNNVGIGGAGTAADVPEQVWDGVGDATPHAYQPGQGTNSATPLAWTPKWSHIGPYRIRLIITSQGGTKISEIEKVVWILPLRLIFIGCILIIIIYRLTYYDKKTIVDI